MYLVFFFRFDLLFVSALWIYDAGLGSDLFVYLLPKKALMSLLV